MRRRGVLKRWIVEMQGMRYEERSSTAKMDRNEASKVGMRVTSARRLSGTSHQFFPLISVCIKKSQPGGALMSIRDACAEGIMEKMHISIGDNPAIARQEKCTK